MSDTEAAQRLRGALDDLDEAIEANIERSQAIQEQVRWLREMLDTGMAVADVVIEEREPRVVELVTANGMALNTAGARLRAAKAQALRAEGMTTEAIAEVFGVSRQRISALLRQKAAEFDE